MSIWPLISATLLINALVSAQAAAQEAIGSVTRMQAAATVMIAGSMRPLQINSPVFTHDSVSTSEGARLEITFVDKTRLTLGENARVTLDEFVFRPSAGVGVVRVGLIGAFRFVSGQATKLTRSDVHVSTPVAAIGIRGTEFWGGPIDDQVLGVFLVDGVITVGNAAGEQTLNQTGQGTNISREGAAPGPVTTWPAEKVARAIATVAFQ